MQLINLKSPKIKVSKFKIFYSENYDVRPLTKPVKAESKFTNKKLQGNNLNHRAKQNL